MDPKHFFFIKIQKIHKNCCPSLWTYLCSNELVSSLPISSYSPRFSPQLSGSASDEHSRSVQFRAKAGRLLFQRNSGLESWYRGRSINQYLAQNENDKLRFAHDDEAFFAFLVETKQKRGETKTQKKMNICISF